MILSLLLCLLFSNCCLKVSCTPKIHYLEKNQASTIKIIKNTPKFLCLKGEESFGPLNW